MFSYENIGNAIQINNLGLSNKKRLPGGILLSLYGTSKIMDLLEVLEILEIIEILLEILQILEIV